MAKKKLNESQIGLMDCLSSALFSNYETDISLSDQMANEAMLQSVFSIIYPCFNEKKFEQHYLACIKENIKLELANVHLHEIFTRNNIPYCIIKGYAAARFYNDPLLRVSCDIDFLVEPENLKKAKHVLTEEGFSKTGKNSHHISYINNDITYEMHFTIAGIPDGAVGDDVRDMVSKIVENRQLFSCVSGDFYIPSDFDHGLIILIHTARHLINSGIGLKHVCDWAVFINHFTEEEFINIFKEKLVKIGLWTWCVTLTALCEKYLNLKHFSFTEKPDDAYLELLLIDIFESGTFGIKDRSRLHAAKLITDDTTANVEDVNYFTRLCRHFSKKAKSEYKFAKFKLLLPLAMLFVAFRFIFDVLRGKRPKINFAQTFSKAQERRNIYRKLRLFEVQNKWEKRRK